jgi:hypothetical protein
MEGAEQAPVAAICEAMGCGTVNRMDAAASAAPQQQLSQAR